MFTELLAQQGVIKALFETFDSHLETSRFKAQKGQTIDAGLISATDQRNKGAHYPNITATCQGPTLKEAAVWEKDILKFQKR